MKDYAKYSSPQRPVSSGYWGYIALFVVLVVVAYGARSFFKAKTEKPALPEPVLIASSADQNAALKSTETVSQPVSATAETGASAAQNPTFDFYDMLSDSSSTPEKPATLSQNTSDSSLPPPASAPAKTAAEQPAATKTAPKAATADNATSKSKTTARQADTEPKQYVIEIAIFTSYQAAQTRRAELILKGVMVELTTLNTRKGPRYRLQTGPYENWRKAHTAQLQLEQQHQLRGKIVGV